ncbi:MAG: right-handed parallel beta-helix repeat-containing protein [Bacteroidota bacterium]
MKKSYTQIILGCLSILLLSFVLYENVYAADPIIIRPGSSDMTPAVRKILEEAQSDHIEIVFEKGTYRFLPDHAAGKYLEITNHGNGFKKVIFDFSKFKSVSIQGNGAEFIFHGLSMPFLFEDSNDVSIHGLTVDWDIPFTFLAEVIAINELEAWRDVKPLSDGFSWILKHGKIHFPNVDGFSYPELGSTLAFDAVEKRPIHGAWDLHSNPDRVEERPNGVIRIHEKLKQYPPVGSLLSSKGDRKHDRYAPAFDFKSCSNVRLEEIVIHHALGMGFLFERTQDISIINSKVVLRKGTNRVISSTADATHFANCKGKILVEGCTFENMLDDGTNVHGTYVEVDSIISDQTVRVELMHFEQKGFPFAKSGDEVWFIQQPSSARSSYAEVTAAKRINETFTDLYFEAGLPSNLKAGDILENKTWNPEFTMRSCTIRHHRARNIVLKTPLKTVIENNYFSSMMSSVFFRGETFFWFESGGVRDVLIQNNTFDYCAYSGAEHAILNITPRLGKAYDAMEIYDRNIRFEENEIRTFGNRIVMADRVSGLLIRNNTIVKVDQAPELYPNAPLFDFKHCENVKLLGNTYQGGKVLGIKADELSAKTLDSQNNRGFDHSDAKTF